MICVYDSKTDDFSTLGLCVLQPNEAEVEEQAAGMFTLTLQHPIDDDGRWRYLVPQNIIKAPVPERETPLVTSEEIVTEPTTITKTRHLSKVRTNTGARLRLHTKASDDSKTIGYYAVGTEVEVVSTSGSFSRVIVCKGGATGYMKSQYLVASRTVTETITTGGSTETVSHYITSMQTRDQLFRITNVIRDSIAGTVTVTANHIFYDLVGCICGAYEANGSKGAKDVLADIELILSHNSGFSIYCLTNSKVTGDFTGMSLVNILLDPDIGIVAQTGTRIIRDNFDVWILPDEVRDKGVEIRHGKNLTGATMTTDSSAIVTRIRPVGETSQGKRLTITENNGFVFSQYDPQSGNANCYPVPMAQEISYDVKVGDGFNTETAARNELKRLALLDFANGADLPSVTLDVDFIQLSDDSDYSRYADLQTVNLYDTVRIVAPNIDIKAKERVNTYVYDCLLCRYKSVGLGDVQTITRTTYGYEIANGSMSGSKLINGTLSGNSLIGGSVDGDKITQGTVDGSKLRSLSIDYAKLGIATVEQLNADSIDALKANINELTAETATVDSIYGAFAKVFQIAVERVRAQEISTDRLASALGEFVGLTAKVANIELANIATAVVKKLALHSNGKYYFLGIDENGNVTATEVTESEASASGREQVDSDVDVSNLETEKLENNTGILSDIISQAHEEEKLTDAEIGVVGTVCPKLYTTYIKSLGSSIKFDATTLDELGNNLAKWMTFSAERGLIIEDPNGANYYTQTDETGYHVFRRDMIQPLMSAEGRGITASALRVGDIIAKKTAGGGWAFVDA